MLISISSLSEYRLYASSMIPSSTVSVSLSKSCPPPNCWKSSCAHAVGTSPFLLLSNIAILMKLDSALIFSSIYFVCP